MSKSQDRIQIVQKIISAANLYKSNFVGKTYLYIFDNRYIEVVYRTKDFLHLTGVNSSLSAKAFYKEASQGTLKHTQIWFNTRHPYDLCLKKAEHIDKLIAVTNTDTALLESVSTDSSEYQFGVTELNFTLCLNIDTDDTGKIVSNYYTPRSLRVEDCFNRCGNVYEVDFILSKSNDTALYSTVTYSDKRKSLDQLPDVIKKRISADLLSKPEPSTD